MDKNKHKSFRDCSITIPLLYQQISDLYVFPIKSYEPLNVQNRMSELCKFSQIQSHIGMDETDSLSAYVQAEL